MQQQIGILQSVVIQKIRVYCSVTRPIFVVKVNKIMSLIADTDGRLVCSFLRMCMSVLRIMANLHGRQTFLVKRC